MSLHNPQWRISLLLARSKELNVIVEQFYPPTLHRTGPDRTDPDHPSEHWKLRGPFSFFLFIVLLCHFSGFSTVMETEAPAGGDLASDDITKGYSANQYDTKEHPPLNDTN